MLNQAICDQCGNSGCRCRKCNGGNPLCDAESDAINMGVCVMEDFNQCCSFEFTEPIQELADTMIDR